MIQVNRIDKPQILVKNAVQWTKEYLQAIENFKINPSEGNKKKKKAAEDKYNNDEVKSSLRAMFYEKCGFCESTVSHVYYGDIEHFRPKKIYPNLCFDWNNYLLSCKICNSTYKRDRFPLADEGGPIINPVDENPNLFFKFIYENDRALLIPKNDRARFTLDFFKLNEREVLLDQRTRIVKGILTIKKAADSGNLDAKKFLLDIDNKYEFLGFIQAIIKS